MSQENDGEYFVRHATLVMSLRNTSSTFFCASLSLWMRRRGRKFTTHVL